MLIYKIATQIQKLQQQGLSLKEVANKLGISPGLAEVGSVVRSQAAKRK